MEELESFHNFVNGEYRQASDGRTLTVENPSTGRPWAQIPRSSPADVDHAVQSAAAAFVDGPWSVMSDAVRAQVLRRLAGLIEEHAQELVRLEIMDTGRSLVETRDAFIPASVQTLYYYAGAADKIHGETVRLSPASMNLILREPLGVVGLVLPYNAPLTVLVSKLGPALAAGNTVVAKASEHAPCSVLYFGQLLVEAGIPTGVVNLLAGLGDEAGAALAAHSLVRKISMTGSARTARAISSGAAESLKQLQFELGGKSPHIFFSDADLDRAVPAAVAGVFTGSAGQACTAGSRILIHDTIWDTAVEGLLESTSQIVVGDPFSETTTMGALSFRQQFEKVRSCIDGGRDDARLRMGGRSGSELFPAPSPLEGGFFVEPTLFEVHDPSIDLVREEVFGPVATLQRFSDDEEALAFANDTRYGLVAGIWTNNHDRILRFSKALQAGVVWANTYRRAHWAIPFGGFKESGFGRDSGTEALREYQQVKSIWFEQGP